MVVVDEGDTGFCFEEPAKRGFGHFDEIGGFGEADGAAEVLVYECHDFVYALTVVVDDLRVVADVFAEGSGIVGY